MRIHWTKCGLASIRPCSDCERDNGRWVPIANRFLCPGCTEQVAEELGLADRAENEEHGDR